ncbi:hypothetical protein DSO57_1020244 [Entomophthora muscae]|uniref:Uncharacterized protein n=1 Tax=Entomophthora muscae TaxID=34485 RepID=A0ACC2TES6_9FUNG|nr:hypothetical protein DSO57_1020244 [Entomophthora muscae]
MRVIGERYVLKAISSMPINSRRLAYPPVPPAATCGPGSRKPAASGPPACLLASQVPGPTSLQLIRFH